MSAGWTDGLQVWVGGAPPAGTGAVGGSLGATPVANPNTDIGGVPLDRKTFRMTLDGVDSGFDTSWMNRGFNIIVINTATNVILNWQRFDTYGSADAAAAMLGYLQWVPEGMTVVIGVYDSAEWWDVANPRLSPALKSYVANKFGATQFSSIVNRANYALIAIKGAAGPPLSEKFSLLGTGAVTATYIFSCMTQAPTTTAAKTCDAGVGFVASSGGYWDGNFASLELYLDGTNAQYDDKWMSRGMNILWTGGANNGVGQATFDLFNDPSASDAMLAFLKSIPPNAFTVFIVKDAGNNPTLTNVKPDLQAYMSSTFLATKFSSLGFRGSYALLSGTFAQPVFQYFGLPIETANIAGQGAVTVSVVVNECDSLSLATTQAPTSKPTLKPTVNPSPKPTAKPVPRTNSPTVRPTPQPTKMPSVSVATIVATSKGYDDCGLLPSPCASTLRVFVSPTNVDTLLDVSWFGRGFNVVVFDTRNFFAQSKATFDTYASAYSASDAMLAFLQSASAGSVVAIVVQDSAEVSSPSVPSVNIKPSLASYVSTNLFAASFSSISYRDSYVLVAVKGSRKLSEKRTLRTLGTAGVTAQFP